MLPENFDEWVSCISKDCRIKLDSSFALKRLQVYEDENNPETKKFIELYGEQHLNNIIHWFSQIV